ncbi:MAG: hypothetical protein M1833_001837 [Piccolia ochrophora]|nr:MAG: hypothetical protein M1833_001837 [Piccolia ochrophora]
MPSLPHLVGEAQTIGPPTNAKRARTSRPNFNKIHACPLPLTVYPLPVFIPHNPLSWLQIAYTVVSQTFLRPSSHPATPYTAYFSPETRSVHVTDPIAIRALWEHGFFGKGSLSRSEPSWLDRERKRRGLKAGDTSEEYTNKRRDERRLFKLERARKEREDIEKQLQEDRGSKKQSNEPTRQSVVKEDSRTQEVPNGHIEDTGRSSTTSDTGVILPPDKDPDATLSSGNGELPHPFHTSVESISKTFKSVHFPTNPEVPHSTTSNQTLGSPILSQEHLQLTLEEAFFLAHGLGVLSIHHLPTASSSTTTPIPLSALLPLFVHHTHIPPLPTSPPPHLSNPFLLSYVTYHHFRSLGWVVRPGIKFGVDYLLYKRGPVFAHAQFAVVVLPAYTHRYWTDTAGGRTWVEQRGKQEEGRPWWWLHCVNRVQGQVQKSLVVVFVEVPPPEKERVGEGEGEGDVRRLLGRYRIREFVVRRWVPNRSRD